MKRAMAVMCLVCFAFPAWAAEPPVKSKFYDMNEMVVQGELKKPSALYVDATERPKFERLLRLKKSFIPALEGAGNDKALK